MLLRPAYTVALAWSFLLLLLPVLAALPAGEGRLPRTLLAVLMSLWAVPALRRDLLRHGGNAVLGLAWDAEGLEVQSARGEREAVHLCHGSLRAGRFAWLLLQGRRRHRVFIDARALDPAAAAALWRALRRLGRRAGELR